MVDVENTVLPVASRNALCGDEGETLVALAVTKAGHRYRQNSGLDFGVDGRIEILCERADGKAVATGREIAVQVKRGRTIVQPTRYGYTHYFSEAHRNYWLGHSLPVILVHTSEDSGSVRWAVVTQDTIRKTVNGFAIDLPADSDLAGAGDKLTKLADPRAGQPLIDSIGGKAKLFIRISPDGELIDDLVEVGLAALEASRDMIRTGHGTAEVEIDGTDIFIAGVDAINDLEAPDKEARRRKISFEDALEIYRSLSHFHTRTLSFLLREAQLMSYFERDDVKLGEAVATLLRRAGRQLEERTALNVWPAAGSHEPAVSFDVSKSELDHMLATAPRIPGSIGLGDASGFLVRDLPSSAIRLGLIPVLCKRLVNYADTAGLKDRKVLSSIGVNLENWMVGLG